MSKQNIKCPICGTVQPFEADFCVYCATVFDKQTVTLVDTPPLEDDNKEKGSQ